MTRISRVPSLVASEAWRIEDKFSRYIPGNIVHRINTASGQPVEVDSETAGLIDFAVKLYEVSEGSFDITAGVLRAVWRFDGGDARRFLLKNGVRYGHILDPRTGWPVTDAPASVTVAAETCTQAGMMSTLAMLEGVGAEDFLADQGVLYWCRRI